MNKKRCITMITVVIVCVLCLGGMAGMQKLLEYRQTTLLSQTGKILANEDKNSQTEELKTELSLEELKEILKSMESDASEEPQEPSKYQMTMKEAISRGQDWIDEFYVELIDQDNNPIKTYDRIMATLCTKQSNTDTILNSDLYGYWRVEYYVEEKEFTLLLNAVTGQLMKFTLTSYSWEELDYEKILTTYKNLFSIEGDILYNTYDCSFVAVEDGSVYAILKEKENVMEQINVELYVSTMMELTESVETKVYTKEDMK